MSHATHLCHFTVSEAIWAFVGEVVLQGAFDVHTRELQVASIFFVGDLGQYSVVCIMRHMQQHRQTST